nr:hypothetical protein BaRGS_022422 [Batillaria attramentaria]
MRLGTGATLEDLLAKFDSIYGTVQQKESVLAQFYSARQREGEDVATWSCRLEDLLMQAESLGKVEPADRNDKLRTMFWTGLLPHLRDKSGHKFDAITDFDRLRVEIRRMEQYDPLRETEKKPAVNKMAQSSAVSKEDPKGQKLEARIQQLTAEIERLKKKQQAEPDAPTSYRDRRGGSSNEVDIEVDGMKLKALLDTGSTVSTISEEWCMALRQKELSRKEALGIVRSCEAQNIIVRPNTTMVIRGIIDKGVDHEAVCAMLQPTSASPVNALLDITPSLVNYTHKKNGFVDVHVANITTQTVSVPPRAILCELQPVTIEARKTSEGDEVKDGETFMDQITIASDSLSEAEVQQLEELLHRFPDCFSKGDLDVGFTAKVLHDINLTDNVPFKQRHRRVPPGMFDQVRDHLQQLLDSGIIRRSHSPWSSNVVLVRKKNNELRLCIDFRQLNARTIKDSYALPRIEEMLDTLAGSKFFSVLDMKSGYHQIEINEEHKERTAFTIAPLGFFEFNRMAMGLANAPATYQRLMEDCLDDLHLRICLVFLDDIIIFSDTFEEHLERIEQVLSRLRDCGLKLSPKKCAFAQERVKYVGHIISSAGVEADPDKCEKVRDWPTPKSPEDVRRFLGFCGYYRRFVKGFSQIARPLTALMPAPTKGCKRKGKRSTPKTERVPWSWGPEQENAFQQLKECLTSPPILGFPDYSSPFVLQTDASTHGLGAILYQMQDGQRRVTAGWLRLRRSTLTSSISQVLGTLLQMPSLDYQREDRNQQLGGTIRSTSARRRDVIIDDKQRNQLVLPGQYIQDVLRSLHDDGGHPGRDRTLSLLRDRFFWPGWRELNLSRNLCQGPQSSHGDEDADTRDAADSNPDFQAVEFFMKFLDAESQRDVARRWIEQVFSHGK